MPYKRVGKTVYHKKNGWKKKQTAGSTAKAKRAMNLLRGVEHGWRPTGEPARDIRKRKKHHSFGLDVVFSGAVPEEYQSAWKGGKKRR